jgi:hypothetical protein
MAHFVRFLYPYYVVIKKTARKAHKHYKKKFITMLYICLE